MTPRSIVALLGAMIFLAAIPSVSVLAVVTRSMAFGLMHGVFTTIGIVLGDIIFIILAIWGLSFLAQVMGNLFVLVNYVGGAYLIALGIGLCRAQAILNESEAVMASSLWSSFLTGILITLGDQKATLFYLGFLPAFVDVSNLLFRDAMMILVIMIIAVGGVKISYAILANHVRQWFSSAMTKRINFVAGFILIMVGIWLIMRSH